MKKSIAVITSLAMLLSLFSVSGFAVDDNTDEVVENFLPANKIIIYYNGVTLEEGIKSTD